ncbi:MAG TPA: hypothetical protein PLH57_08535 [Oligoflexia bacterium]|nr:hypothetical protein [Oligoflexia bacterium]
MTRWIEVMPSFYQTNYQGENNMERHEGNKLEVQTKRAWTRAEAKAIWKANFRELLLIGMFAGLGAAGLLAVMFVTTARAALAPGASVVQEQVFEFQANGSAAKKALGDLQIRLIENGSRAVRGSIWSIQSKSRKILANCVEEKIERFSAPPSGPKLVHFECTDASLGTMRMPLIIVWSNANAPNVARASLGSALFGNKLQGSLKKL